MNDWKPSGTVRNYKRNWSADRPPLWWPMLIVLVPLISKVLM